MIKIVSWVLLSSVMSLLSFAAVSARADKSAFTLFDPTPRDQMRPMATDRPDTTESPITVDAGHLQLEMSLVEHAWDGDERSLAVAPFNLKVGLTNQIDLQFIATPYERTSINDGDDDRLEGFADDTQLRLKINLWGNDAPDKPWQTALAVMPFVKIPGGASELSNDHWEGGLIVPLSVQLPGDFALGLMAEVDVVYAGDDEDYGVAFVHTATISHDIPGLPDLAGYVEYIGIAPHDIGETYQALASTGLTYAINDDWIIDAGARFGISESEEDVAVFVGTSVRR